MDEADLIARVVLHDDHHAFSQLVRLHQSALRLYLRRLTCGDVAWADDLAQETFFQGYKKVRTFRNDARFRTWLFSIATNLYRSETRRTRYRAEEVSDAPPTSAAIDADPERGALHRSAAAARDGWRAQGAAGDDQRDRTGDHTRSHRTHAQVDGRYSELC